MPKKTNQKILQWTTRVLALFGILLVGKALFILGDMYINYLSQLFNVSELTGAILAIISLALIFVVLGLVLAKTLRNPKTFFKKLNPIRR